MQDLTSNAARGTSKPHNPDIVRLGMLWRTAISGGTSMMVDGKEYSNQAGVTSRTRLGFFCKGGDRCGKTARDSRAFTFQKRESKFQTKKEIITDGHTNASMFLKIGVIINISSIFFCFLLSCYFPISAGQLRLCSSGLPKHLSTDQVHAMQDRSIATIVPTTVPRSATKSTQQCNRQPAKPSTHATIQCSRKPTTAKQE